MSRATSPSAGRTAASPGCSRARTASLAKPCLASEPATADLARVGRAEVGELEHQVGVGFEALRGDLAVAQPGEPVAVDILDGPAAVGIEGGLGGVVAQDVGQELKGG